MRNRDIKTQQFKANFFFLKYKANLKQIFNHLLGKHKLNYISCWVMPFTSTDNYLDRDP